MGLMDDFQFRDAHLHDSAAQGLWLALLCRPRRPRQPRAPQAPQGPQPVAWSPTHRCRHPWLHRLLILSVCGAWLAWSIPFTLSVGPWLARLLFAPNTPLQLIPIVLAWIPWLLFVVPGGTGLLWGIALDRCGSVPQMTAPRQTLPPPVPGQPVMIERVMLTPEDAARRGLPGPVIVERIHYREE